MVQCMDVTGYPTGASISKVLKSWQNYKRNSVYGTVNKHPLGNQLKSSSLTLLFMFLGWLLITLQGIFIWGMAVPYGVVAVLQSVIFFTFNVGQRYSAFWGRMADLCETTLPCLKSVEDEEEESAATSTVAAPSPVLRHDVTVSIA